MHLRRALLLFAIVLGLAALATAASRPQQRGSSRAPATQPSAVPAPQAVEPARVRIGPRSSTRARKLEAATPTEVLVEVPKPGEVELEGLGLSAAAEPLTPARFDVLTSTPGRVQVLFTPAGERGSLRLGSLTVEQ